MAAAAAAAPSPLQPGDCAPGAGAELAASEVASSALRSVVGLAGQPLLEKLQPLIKEEGIGHVETAGKTEGQTCETNLNIYDDNSQTEEKYASYDLGDLKDAHINFDPEVVQIKAGKAEIDRRISAFIERKQAEINENNVREFCNVIDCNQENSCARTDAIFTPYPGFKSHIKVSRVVNTYGPQTRFEGAHGSSHKASVPIHDCGNQAVEERLQNIEAHLRLQTELFWQEEKGSTSASELFVG